MNNLYRLLKNVDHAAHQAATSPANTRPQPTEAQAKAGNYKKGKIRIGGLDISIENPAGSTRNPAWPTMSAHYGDIKRTEGNDGDALDVFVKPGTSEEWSGTLYVIDQKHDGIDKFDEHKVMLGWDSELSAKRAYLSHYSRNWERNIIGIRAFTMDKFKEWMIGDLSKPCSKVALAGMLIKAKPTELKSSPASLYSKNHAKIVGSVTKFLDEQAKVIIPQVIKAYPKAQKNLIAGILRKETPDEMVDKVKFSGWDSMVDEIITPEVEAAFAAAGLWAALQVIKSMPKATEAVAATATAVQQPATIEVMTSLVNDDAVLYAKARSGELITQITDSTLAMVKETVAGAIQDGLSSYGLADRLAASRAFSPQRADLIASYELGTASEAGNMSAWKRSGVVTGKRWIATIDAITSDICQINAEQGIIPLDEVFESGDMHPLAHPHCRCSLSASTKKIG